ncbi:putative 85 kDa calcium-independent phospholipase A2-like [Apostichopus japonicus]|uniref:phospholipase A2 n=1 Tax=Stichopus japonicus TaxID=307972 RepID=A0A2G8JWI4_STIJA|nr:putative 85 kDa calcium-independent phospholipase A2-like [Apostichopus japonicus]
MELNLQQKTGEIVAVLEQRFVIFWKNLLFQFFLQCLAKISRVFNFLYGCFNLYEDAGGRSVRDRLDPKLSAVLDDEYELNARRRHGETLVHDAVRNERLDCLIELLLSGADLEISDDEGNAPLHTAVQLNNPHLVYALIAFNAYVNVKNHSGQTPRHIAAQHEEKGADILCALHSMGAERCNDNMTDCKDGCRCQGYYDGLPQESQFDISDELEKVYDPFLEMTISSLREQAEKNPPKKGEARRAETVLCLDGGGIRGLVLVLILEAIERASDKRIVDSFDWIVGTSAGAVLAASLLHGK